jgi:MoaA/NifB/PqqE/SkfB family radical SAM enzyme
LPETHDAITRTPGSHGRTVRAIRRAVDDGLKVRVGVISMVENQHDASETRQYLQGLGVPDDSIRFDQMRDVGRGNPSAVETNAQPVGVQTGGVESARPRNFGAPPRKSLLQARERWGEKLSCWECQARSVLLDGSCNA